MRSKLAQVFTAAFLALATLAPAAEADPRVTGLGAGANLNVLFSFDAATPGATNAVPVTGLGLSTLVGIDRRPADGLLYGLGVNGNTTTMFKIDPTTGAANSVGSASVNAIVGATAWGVDFNPVSDRMRVVNDLASGVGNNTNNFRLRPDNGQIAGIDTDLDFSAVPGSASEVAIAHDRSVAGATATTLFGVTAVGDMLVRQGGVDSTPSPNGGVISAIGPLGVDITTAAGLDIDPATGLAFGAFTTAGVSGLYRVNLATGAASLIGKVGNGSISLSGLTIDPPPVGPPPPPPPVEPRLSALSLRPRSFASVNAGGAILSKARKAPIGTTVNYALSTTATATFRIERKGTGRRVGKACKKLTPGNRGRKPCPLFKPLSGSFDHPGAAGANSFKFTGRLGGKALRPGSYRLVASAATSTRRTSFKIVPALSGRR